MEQTRVGSRRERHTRPTSASSTWRLLLLVLAVVVAAAVSYVVTSVSVVLTEMYEPLPEPQTPSAAVRATPVTEGGRINVLVMGLDDEKLRSDTMMLVSIDPERSKVGVVQIPRDTRARLAGKGTIEKINGAYAYGVGDRDFPAPLRSMKTVEELLGVRVHYHVTLDMAGFKKIIDSVGGVWVDVPFAMDYDDPYQNLHIHLKAGRQKLNGEQALKFVRWRKNNDGSGYPDGDLGRIRTQQKFIQSLMESLFRPSNLPFLMNQAVTVSKYVETTMEPTRLVSLAKLAVTLKKDDFEFVTVPGVDAYLWDNQEQKRLSFFVPDPVASQQLLDRVVRGIDRSFHASIRVEVATAGSTSRAGAVADQLASLGFLVKPVARTSQAVPAIVRVLDHAADSQKAHSVARALVSLGYRVEMVKALDPDGPVDVTVLLGRDLQ